MNWGLRSLRARTLAVVCVVVVAPVIFVWLSSPFEDALGGQLRSSLRTAADVAADHVRTDAPEDDFADIARRLGVRIRVVDADRKVVHDVDGTGTPSWREWLMFAPEAVPQLADWEALQPPVAQRPEVDLAFVSGRAAACSYQLDDRLLVCQLAVRVNLAGMDRGRVMYVAAATARGASGLYGERYLILKLTILVLVLAGGLGGWLAYRIQRPMRDLRDQVLERTRPPVSTRPVELSGDDDFAELADAFNALLGALERQRRENEGFMADMAHEVKNPVAAIRAAAESLDKGGDVPAKRAERLAKILSDSSRRLDRVVVNFLELARAESGLPEASRVALQLDELLDNALQTYRADEQYAHIELSLDSSDVRVLGSADHLERAVRNLVENALSFASSRVRVAAVRDLTEVVLTIEDDGPGIAEEDHERVFERFFTRRHDGGGTGLGLAMTRAIVEAHAGSIAVSSEPGKGTTFTIRLPAA